MDLKMMEEEENIFGGKPAYTFNNA